MQDAPFFNALVHYLGGKRRLAPLIFAALAEAFPPSEWPGASLLDPMCGGGAVALAAKAQGFGVVAGDVAERALVPARALVANSSVCLVLSDVLALYGGGVGVQDPAGVPAADQAGFLTAARARADERAEPVRSLLRLVLVKWYLRGQPMSLPSGTDAAAAAAGDFDRVSSRRLATYLPGQRPPTPESLWAIAEQVNAGVFGGGGEAHRADACTLLAQSPAEVAYLDPPYPGTSGYRREYAVLDALLGDTAIPTAPLTLDALLDAAAPIPWLVLSYGGPRVTLPDLVATVARHRPVRRAFAIPHPRLAALARKETNDASREFLIVAGC